MLEQELLHQRLIASLNTFSMKPAKMELVPDSPSASKPTPTTVEKI